MINVITPDNRSMKAKEYMFHVDLIHLETYYEDWYEEFPVLLTDEEFDELCKAQREWMQTEEWINRHSDADEEYFIKKHCPNIYPKVKTSLEKFALFKLIGGQTVSCKPQVIFNTRRALVNEMMVVVLYRP